MLSSHYPLRLPSADAIARRTQGLVTGALSTRTLTQDATPASPSHAAIQSAASPSPATTGTPRQAMDAVRCARSKPASAAPSWARYALRSSATTRATSSRRPRRARTATRPPATDAQAPVRLSPAGPASSQVHSAPLRCVATESSQAPRRATTTTRHPATDAQAPVSLRSASTARPPARRVRPRAAATASRRGLSNATTTRSLKDSSPSPMTAAIAPVSGSPSAPTARAQRAAGTESSCPDRARSAMTGTRAAATDAARTALPSPATRAPCRPSPRQALPRRASRLSADGRVGLVRNHAVHPQRARPSAARGSQSVAG